MSLIQPRQSTGDTQEAPPTSLTSGRGYAWRTALPKGRNPASPASFSEQEKQAEQSRLVTDRSADQKLEGSFLVVQRGGQTANAKINRTSQKSAIDHKKFLKQIKQSRQAREQPLVVEHPVALKVGFQSSMSEEHPPSPSKIIDIKDDDQNEELTSLGQSKIISYRPSNSICDSDNSHVGDCEQPALGSDSDSGNRVSSKGSLKKLNSNLYRYVTSFGVHQIETADQLSFGTHAKSGEAKDITSDSNCKKTHFSSLQVTKQTSSSSTTSSNELAKKLKEQLGGSASSSMNQKQRHARDTAYLRRFSEETACTTEPQNASSGGQQPRVVRTRLAKGGEVRSSTTVTSPKNAILMKSRRQAGTSGGVQVSPCDSMSQGGAGQATLIVPRQVITMHGEALLNSDRFDGAAKQDKRASSAIPKLNLNGIQQAPKKSRKITNLRAGGCSVNKPERQLVRDSSRQQAHHQALMPSSRNKIYIPKVVRAIGNIQAATCRTSVNCSPTAEKRSSSARSKSSADTRERITLKKRLVPLDIITDAKVNSSEVAELTDRSQSRKSERRTNRHHYIGESGDPEVKELLRMASQSASRERRIISPKDEKERAPAHGRVTRVLAEPKSPESDIKADLNKVFRTQAKPFTKWNSNTDVFAQQKNVISSEFTTKSGANGNIVFQINTKGVRNQLARRNYQARCSSNASPITNFSQQDSVGVPSVNAFSPSRSHLA